MNLRAPFWEASIFVAFTCLISWTSWFISTRMAGLGIRFSLLSMTISVSWMQIFLALGYFGPGISAITIHLASSKRSLRFRRLWTSLTTLHDSWGWLVFALLVVPIIDILAVMLYIKMGGNLAGLNPLSLWPYLFLTNLPLASVPGEVGWRGFLLPRVIECSNKFIASVVVGLVTAFWYSPFFGVLSAHSRRQEWVSFLYYASMVVAMAVIHTCVYLKTSGSLIPVIVLHSSALASEVTLSRILSPGGMHPFVWASQGLWVVALVVYGLTQKSFQDVEID